MSCVVRGFLAPQGREHRSGDLASESMVRRRDRSCGSAVGIYSIQVELVSGLPVVRDRRSRTAAKRATYPRTVFLVAPRDAPSIPATPIASVLGAILF
jgi:hypothetical protein